MEITIKKNGKNEDVMVIENSKGQLMVLEISSTQKIELEILITNDD